MNDELISRKALLEHIRFVYKYTDEEEYNRLVNIIYSTPIVCSTEDCISRAGAINALSKGKGCGNVCRKALETIPSVQFIERPTGEWIDMPFAHQCTNCYKGTVFISHEYAFCPNCGAKMKGEEE